jgi:hypothetical protein
MKVATCLSGPPLTSSQTLHSPWNLPLFPKLTLVEVYP